MLKLLRNVRKAYKQWRALPGEERERFTGEIQRIRGLVRELGGARAVQFMEGADDEPVAEVDVADAPADRNRSQVVVELKEATAALVAAMARPAGQLAADSVPRSVRIGGKIASASAKRLGRGRHDSGA